MSKMPKCHILRLRNVQVWQYGCQKLRHDLRNADHVIRHLVNRINGIKCQNIDFQNFLLYFLRFPLYNVNRAHFMNFGLKFPIFWFLNWYDAKTWPPGLHLHINEKKVFWNTLIVINMFIYLFAFFLSFTSYILNKDKRRNHRV